MKIDKGLLAASIAPLFIALSITLVKIAGNDAPPLVTAGLGPLFSLPFLLLLQIGSKTPLALGQLLKAPLLNPFLRVVVTRSIIGQILIIAGFSLTSAVKSVLLLRLEPLFVVLWAVLLAKERPGVRKISLLILLVLGSAIVVAPGSPATIDLPGAAPNWGDAMVITSLVFFSYSYTPTQEVVARANPAALNILGNLIGGSVVSLIALCLYGPAGFVVPINSMLMIVSYSFIFFACGCSLYFYAFKSLKPWVIASFLSLEVVFGLGLAFLILHERMTGVQLLGALIVCLAMLGIARHSHLEQRDTISP